MKDLKSGNGAQDALLGDTTGSSSAVSPNSSITDPLPTQLATLANLRAFNPLTNNLTTASLDSPSLDPQALANLHTTSAPSNRPYVNLFPGADSSMVTSDQFLKAAKLLGIGLNPTPPGVTAGGTSAGALLDRTSFRNEDVDLNEISEFIERLSIVNSLNNDEKVLNAAICILFNGLPLALLNPGNVAEEIYSSKLFYDLSLFSIEYSK